MNAPRKFNSLREVSKKYDVLEAYSTLRKGGIIGSAYEYSEEILEPRSVYSPEGRSAFVKGVRRLSTRDDVPRVGIYTCGGFTFLIGCKAGHFFLIDTHSISTTLGGNGNGILKVFPRDDNEATTRLCSWVWKRLKTSRVDQKQLQSFAITEQLR